VALTPSPWQARYLTGGLLGAEEEAEAVTEAASMVLVGTVAAVIPDGIGVESDE